MIQLRREVTYLLTNEAKGAHERAWLYCQSKVYRSLPQALARYGPQHVSFLWWMEALVTLSSLTW